MAVWNPGDEKHAKEGLLVVYFSSHTTDEAKEEGLVVYCSPSPIILLYSSIRLLTVTLPFSAQANLMAKIAWRGLGWGRKGWVEGGEEGLGGGGGEGREAPKDEAFLFYFYGLWYLKHIAVWQLEWFSFECQK